VLHFIQAFPEETL